LLVDNLNERDSGWSVGSYVDSVEKVISFNHTSCNDALRQMAEAFNTEYEIIGKQISLRRVEYNKDNPLALSYGFGNGFKSGVKRENSGDSKAIEILYVQGGERNVNPTIYGSQELLLPKSKL
jgi:predicted small secreted protein